MLIITIRTDKPEAEIGLYEDQDQLSYEIWEAGRQLSMTIHKKIDDILKDNSKKLEGVKGIVCFAGPGSFTGLRIGITVGNALAYGLDAGVVAAMGKNWISDGIKRLMSGDTDKMAVPEYGADVHITKQRK